MVTRACEEERRKVQIWGERKYRATKTTSKLVTLWMKRQNKRWRNLWTAELDNGRLITKLTNHN